MGEAKRKGRTFEERRQKAVEARRRADEAREGVDPPLIYPAPDSVRQQADSVLLRLLAASLIGRCR